MLSSAVEDMSGAKRRPSNSHGHTINIVPKADAKQDVNWADYYESKYKDDVVKAIHHACIDCSTIVAVRSKQGRKQGGKGPHFCVV